MKRKKIVFTYKTRVRIEIQGYLNVLTKSSSVLLHGLAWITKRDPNETSILESFRPPYTPFLERDPNS